MISRCLAGKMSCGKDVLRERCLAGRTLFTIFSCPGCALLALPSLCPSLGPGENRQRKEGVRPPVSTAIYLGRLLFGSIWQHRRAKTICDALRFGRLGQWNL